MFKQGLGRITVNGNFETLYAEYEERDKSKRVFVLETRMADRPDCPGENRYGPTTRKMLSNRKALAFLNQQGIKLTSSGKEAIVGKPNERPRLIINTCPSGWTARVVLGWATHIETKAVRSWEDGAVELQYLASYK
jgi:hypothetical protein